MNNISENIKAIGSIIDELSIEPDKIAEFRAQYKKILQRSRDKKLYLSTIGDFSSGKSTLINTLIKRRLLKVAHAATTAVPTYICRGDEDSLSVIIKCKNNRKYDLTLQEDAEKFEKAFGVVLPEEIGDRISLLTADKELSLKIREVDILLPKDELTGELCIIDTPGVNPGADNTEHHAELTKQILDETADAVIILFPADQAYTQSFDAFLKDNAECFMKDAIFVVTMIDRVDEEEREDVINFVKSNLRVNFNLEDPQVLSCAALKNGRDPYWTERFQEFEGYLLDRLAENRQRIISEKLVKLSNELLVSIGDAIASRREGLDQKLSVLSSHSVPRLVGVLEECEAGVSQQLSRIREEHDLELSRCLPELEGEIRMSVNLGLGKCYSRSSVTSFVKNYLASYIEKGCKKTQDKSTAYTEQINTVLSDTVSKMIEKLKVYYGEIGSILPESSEEQESGIRLDIADKISDLSGMISSHEGKITAITTLGGAGLAAIILTGLGPVGWIIGGAVAMVGGDTMFVESARKKVRDSVAAKIPGISRVVIQELSAQMQGNLQRAQKALEEKKAALVSQYQPVYLQLESELEQEKQSLVVQIEQGEKTRQRIAVMLREMSGL